MSFSSTTSRNDYTGNNSTAVYSYTFYIFNQSDLKVTVRDTNDIETELVLTTDYTVTGAGSANGGTITLLDGNLATGYILTIRRVLEITQETDIRNQGAFYPEVHEDQFDRSIMIAQQQQDELDRSIKLPETIDPADFNAALPTSIVGAVNQTVMTNATGDGFEPGPTANEITNAQGYAAAAAASQAAAAASESAAAASASAAAVSASASQWTDVQYLTSASSPFTVTDGMAGTLFEVDCTSGAVTINLPAIAGLTLSGPWSIGVKKTDSSANAVTIARGATDTIDGATSKVISRQYAGCSLIPDIDLSPDKWTSLTFGEVPISGAIVGTTDTQSLTNKTFDNSNTFTIRDDRLTIQDNADVTKQVVFDLSEIATATTKTVQLAKPPTIQKFTSGSGTYTLPTNCLYIDVTLVGGGGGGAGSGNSGAGQGGAGGNTTFGSTIVVGNGGAATTLGIVPGAGGTASLGAGAIGIAIQGGSGGGGSNQGTGVQVQGGTGAASPFGGQGASGFGGNSTGGAGGAAIANTGSGGGGAGGGTTANSVEGAGGSAGGYCKALITSPASSYAYAVGAGGSAGSAGTNGSAGGAGGSGIIIVTEYY